MGDYDYYGYYEKKKAIRVKNGIRTLSKRGEIGSRWWSKRWLEVLDSFGWENRLARGRSYARRGQVTSLKIEKGRITARVQGSMPRPYSVSIAISMINDDGWGRIEKLLGNRYDIMAGLVAGEMPEGINELLNGEGFNLFPKSARDMQTKCSCPDTANPCKHIAAVCYIVSERLGIDPFLLFYMKGRSREELLGALPHRAAGKAERAAPGTAPRKPRRDPRKLAITFWERKPFRESRGLIAEELLVSPIKRTGLPEGADSPDIEREIESFYGAIASGARKALAGSEDESRHEGA